MIQEIYNIQAVFLKQKTELYRNAKMLIMYIIFPLMALFLEFVLHESTSYYLFMVMNIVMPAITCISSTVSEDMETGTYKSLYYAGVSPISYFIGIAFCHGLLNFMSACIMCMMIPQTVIYDDIMLVAMGVGMISSLLLGGAVGLIAKKQVNVAAISAPVSMILGMLPVLGLASPSIHRVTRFIYIQVVADVLHSRQMTVGDIIILVSNIVILGCLLVTFFATKRK